MTLIDVIRKYHKDLGGEMPEHFYEFLTHRKPTVPYVLMKHDKEQLISKYKDMILAAAISGCPQAKNLIKNEVANDFN